MATPLMSLDGAASTSGRRDRKAPADRTFNDSVVDQPVRKNFDGKWFYGVVTEWAPDVEDENGTRWPGPYFSVRCARADQRERVQSAAC